MRYKSMVATNVKMIREAVEAFEEKYDQDTLISMFANNLKHHKYADIELAVAASYVTHFMKQFVAYAAINAVSNGGKIFKPGIIDLKAVWLSTRHTADYEQDNSFVAPWASRFDMKRQEFACVNRVLPLNIFSDHIETRFYQAGEQDFDYKKSEFLSSMLVGMALSLALKDRMDKQGEDHVPVMIPAKAGLYLGYASRVQQDRFYARHFALAANKGKGAGNAVIALETDKARSIPLWSPEVAVTLKTFLPAAKFSKDQSDVFHQYRQLLSNEDFITTLDQTIISYYAAISPVPENLGYLTDAITKIIGQRPWEVANKPSWKHLPTSP